MRSKRLISSQKYSRVHNVTFKRYKYNSKERDEESGLDFYGARYYANWLCRFVSVDPLKDDYPHYTSYQYAGNKPITYIDLDGLEEADPNEIPLWKSLIQFKPSKSTATSLQNRNFNDAGKSILNKNKEWKVQDINNASGEKVNLDFYSVTVNKLPTVGGKQLTAPQLLEYVRKNFNQFIDNEVTSFRGYSKLDEKSFQSNNPLNSAMTFDIGGDSKNPFKNIDDAAVIMATNNENGWIFTTIQTPDDFQHPVSGNRYFGFVENKDGSFTFFTKGADRLTGFMDELLGDPEAFDSADELWVSFQEKLQSFINKNEGEAEKEKPITVQPQWEDVKYLFDL